MNHPKRDEMFMGERRKSFTLIELLIVIAIVAILAGAMAPLIGSSRKETMVVRAANDFEILRKAWMRLYLDVGWYPNDTDYSPYGGNEIENTDLLAPVLFTEAQGWNGPYIDRAVDTPWGGPYRYDYDDNCFPGGSDSPGVNVFFYRSETVPRLSESEFLDITARIDAILEGDGNDAGIFRNNNDGIQWVVYLIDDGC